MNLERVDAAALGRDLDAGGFARLGPVLTPSECDDIAALYGDAGRFRSTIDMARYRFGVGEYKYFANPLPEIVAALRERLYAPLAPIANAWATRLKPRAPQTSSPLRKEREALAERDRYPPTLAEYLERCHRAGQTRPTPLVLEYEAGGYNCLHQDIYGELAFPLQVVFVLSRPGVDFTGGELLLVEQRPRAQSRGHALAIEQGAGVVFTTRERPVAGSRGDYRTAMRHGVSTVTSGRRLSLGIIFHDAK